MNTVLHESLWDVQETYNRLQIPVTPFLGWQLQYAGSPGSVRQDKDGDGILATQDVKNLGRKPPEAYTGSAHSIMQNSIGKISSNLLLRGRDST